MRMSRAIALWAAALAVTQTGCDWNFGGDPPDAGPQDQSCLEGQIQLLGPQAAGAAAGGALMHARAQLTRARFEAGLETVPPAHDPAGALAPTGRAAAEASPDQPALDGVPALRVAPRSPDWLPGSLIFVVEDELGSAARLAEAANTFLDGAGFAALEATDASCVAHRLCRVYLRDAGGKRIDKGLTKAVEGALRARSLEGVRAVAADHLYHGLRLPSDTYYTVQRWHYEALNLPAAWEITTGDPNLVVAVVDSGLNLSHPDIQGRVADGIDMVSEESIAGDGNGRDADPTDPGVGTNFHGTHVAGTVAAVTDNDLGAAGVTWAGYVQPIRVLGQGTAGSAFDILSGLYWAVGETDFEDEEGNLAVPTLNDTPARVVNLSLGSPYQEADFQIWQEIVDDILNVNAAEYGYPVLVVAAGNEDQPADNLTPGNIGQILTVGAHRYDGQRSSYSNYGNLIDVTAPGGQTDLDQNGDGYPDGVLSLQANDFNFQQGTSMAAPHVSGVAALLLAVNPDLTHDEIVQILRSTANPDGVCDVGCGTGRVDAVEALVAAGGEVAPTPQLSVDQSVMLFPSGIEELDLRLRNVGGAPASFELDIIGPQADAFGVSEASGTVPAQGSTVIRVSATRGQLTSGFANLEISGVGDAAGQQYFVDLAFNDQAVPPKFQINVVEVGAYRDKGDGTYGLVGETAKARRDGQFQWEICGLPDGELYVFAVGDDNSDGVFDSQQESFGAWPFVSSPEPIVLEKNTVTRNVDFTLQGGFVLDGAGAVGKPCTSDDECTWAADAACILGESGWPGGYCSRLCSDGYCGAGASCEALECGGESCAVCMVSCTTDSQCRTEDGYVCDDYYTCSPEGFGG